MKLIEIREGQFIRADHIESIDVDYERGHIVIGRGGERTPLVMVADYRRSLDDTLRRIVALVNGAEEQA